jgi:hypothetical protein
MHPLVSSILLGMAGLDPLEANARASRRTKMDE